LNQAKTDALDQMVKQLQARWGNGALTTLKQLPTIPPKRLVTGFSALDTLLDGGLLRGQLVQLRGVHTSGILTITLQTLSIAQQQSSRVVYVDVAHDFDGDYAVRCGLDLERLLLVRPVTFSDALNIAYELIDRYNVDLLVVVMGLQLRLERTTHISVTQAVRRFVTLVRRSACLVLYVTPLVRSNAAKSFFDSYAPLTLTVERVGWLEAFDELSGYTVQVLLTNHKGGESKQPATFAIAFTQPGGLLR
jgi:hypothetical protein